MILFDEIEAQLPEWRKRVTKLVKENGSFKVADLTVEQIYGGIRGVPIQVSDISYVDPLEGIRYRGYSVLELVDQLPKLPGHEYPLVGGLYYLLMANTMPTMEKALAVEDEWRKRSEVPEYVYDIVRMLPDDTHPMTLFSMAVLAMQRESVFAQKYYRGEIKKADYWEGYLEDSLNLTAKLPAIAAFIYSYKYNGKKIIPPDPKLDWAANFAHMIGKSDDLEYQELCRLYFILHSDHEGGNVSAHASHLVASALSDIYLACSAGLNGLAGPLHGLANQDCIRWLQGIKGCFADFPEKDCLEDHIKGTLNSGQIIPGYGHAVLRTTDPRFTAQLKFGQQHFPQDDLFRLVKLVYEVMPELLKSQGKVKNPFPNVDAINGVMQHHYGITQHDFYTVLFGVSRLLGLTTHNVWARVLNKPIERPKSLTTRMLEDMVAEVQVPQG